MIECIGWIIKYLTQRRVILENLAFPWLVKKFPLVTWTQFCKILGVFNDVSEVSVPLGRDAVSLGKTLVNFVNNCFTSKHREPIAR